MLMLLFVGLSVFVDDVGVVCLSLLIVFVGGAGGWVCWFVCG